MPTVAFSRKQQPSASTVMHVPINLTNINRGSNIVIDLILKPLDPFDFSELVNIEEGLVFLWEVVSPHYTGNEENLYYLSASCGVNLQILQEVSTLKNL